MATGDMAYFARPSSSAVKIVAPSTIEKPASPKPSPRKDSTQRQCRNILIYGSCKFQDKGCIYYHPPQRDTSSPVPPDSPVPAPALPAQSVNAPVFVPKTPNLQPASPPPTSPQSSHYFQQPLTSTSGLSEFNEDPVNYDPYAYPSSNVDMLSEQLQALNPYDDPLEGGHLIDYDTSNPMDLFYSQQPNFAQHPLNYHLYTQPRPESLQHRFFISDSVREELQKRSETTHAAPPSGLNLPEELQGYHSLVPLEPTVGDRRKFGNWYSTVYRAINSKDGMPYVLRRIENYRLSQQAAFTCIEAWSRIRHPSIVTIKEAFTTRAFSDNSLVVVYEYHANSQTMNEAHIKQKAPVFHNGRLQSQNVRIAERTLWSYIVQIASAIRTAHEAGLAVRVIDVNKIIVTDRNRIRIAACGLVDVLSFDVHQDLALLQQEDLHMFGKLIYQLCCNNASALNNVVRAVDTVNRHYSQELQNIANDLIQKSGPPRKALHELFAKIQKRVVADYEESLLAVDRLQGELMSELENGRLVRLLCKFNFINERPEFARDSRWSETGDRYIVKLFRDYVFHQVDEHGRPVVNLSHVLTCLNKLDAGTEERIMLVSRDEQSCLVVSYKEIKSCVESAFSELGLGNPV